MKRSLIALLFVVLILAPVDTSQAKKKKKKSPPPKPCVAKFEDCEPEGCSDDNHHDPELNQLKNAVSSDKPVQDRTLDELIALNATAKKKGYKKGKSRSILEKLGEGTQARVVGYLLAVKKEGRESCNCNFDEVDVLTDNHLVLVNPDIIDKFKLPEPANSKQLKAVFDQREPFSVTAEFTPRVRADGHPNFTRKIQFEKLNKTKQGALWVRVTGQLMLDSQHFGTSKPVRATHWEIHPILKLEFCPEGKKCTKTGNANWVDLDSVP